MNIKDLAAPFPPNKIHWRPGATSSKDGKKSAIPLAYLDARDVMERLDEVCGTDFWQNKHPFNGCCEISILTENGWVTKSNGAGKTQIEGEKGEYSDSFKRAAVLWGIGRYLYDIPNIWMPLNQYNKFDKSTIVQLTAKIETWQLKKFGEKK